MVKEDLLYGSRLDLKIFRKKKKKTLLCEFRAIKIR